jgi:hypothetical protein
MSWSRPPSTGTVNQVQPCPSVLIRLRLRQSRTVYWDVVEEHKSVDLVDEIEEAAPWQVAGLDDTDCPHVRGDSRSAARLIDAVLMQAAK